MWKINGDGFSWRRTSSVSRFHLEWFSWQIKNILSISLTQGDQYPDMQEIKTGVTSSQRRDTITTFVSSSLNPIQHDSLRSLKPDLSVALELPSSYLFPLLLFPLKPDPGRSFPVIIQGDIDLIGLLRALCFCYGAMGLHPRSCFSRWQTRADEWERLYQTDPPCREIKR